MQALWMALGALFFTLMALCIRLASEAHGIMEILVYRGPAQWRWWGREHERYRTLAEYVMF